MTSAASSVTLLCCALSVALLSAGMTQDQQATGPQARSKDKIERLALTSGAAPVARKGSVEGQVGQSFIVAGKKGQTVTVELRSTSSSIYFNLRPADSPEALYASDRDETGNQAKIALPTDGDYRIDVYLVRAVARRGVKATFTINLGLSE